MIESVLEPLFHVSSLAKTWTIAEVGTNFVISNSHLEAESISLYESICDETTGLDIGRCSSARFSFTTLDIDLELINKVFDVSFTFESEPNTPFVVGRFKVVEDRPSLDRRNRTVVMYDALYDVLNTNYASWYNNLTWTSMTLGGFIDSFLSHVGITAETASRAELVNASMPITKTLQTNELSGSTILHAVCEVAGCFGVMTRANEFRFLYLKSDIEGLFPANDLYPAEDLYPIEPVTTRIDQSEYYPPLWYETYRTPSISKLFITESADSLGTVVGSGDAEYDIIGNFLLFGKEATDLNTIGLNILGVLEKRNYRPFSVSKVGNLCFELGDPIRMENDRMSVESYVLSRTFKGTQGFIDDISAEGVQSYTQKARSANTTYEQLQSKTLVLEKSVDGLSSRLTYELDDTIQGSYAYQTAQEIGAKVDETHGNLTTGFSWVLTSSGHTWYKDNTEMMKINGNGLYVRGNITAGSTISSASIYGGTIQGSTFYCGEIGHETTYIDAEGQEAYFANETTEFSFSDNTAYVSLGLDTITINLNTVTEKSTLEIGNGVASIENFNIYNVENFDSEDAYGNIICQFEADHDNGDDTTSSLLSIGSDTNGSGGIEKVAINGFLWLHIGVSSPSIHIGNSDSTDGTDDLRIQAKSSSNIVFKYGNTSKSLATILSDISNAATTADNAASGVYNLYQTLMTSIAPTLNTLVSEARDHGWNV